ncbi:agmatine coumaroyltransferase-2-like [Impatiens glandulifera]|uniref:agmatine coumaroyltransferase-2-like n=1 Tax=Impatiens glandulifera TaxID=253017 RepID=UPI001FB0E6C5|nr:agmatine coumaroyltransferase-2-like [Impatiens glandulifera]
MKVRRESTRIIKPTYEGKPPSTKHIIPLSVFDKVTYDCHIAVIYAYRKPSPTTATLELGLQKALAVYREWAGRLGKNENGEKVIFLNDEGVTFVEATVDNSLDQVMSLKPSASILNLHPSLKDPEALVQVQVTRFTCGSLVVGFTAHHHVADGQSTSNFLVAWGQASQGIDISPIPFHDRTIFSPREPPIFEFDHREVEFSSKVAKKVSAPIENDIIISNNNIVVHKVHFTKEFLNKLKLKTSSSAKPYTTFVSLLAHLWRSVTKARCLSGFETTGIRISVNGRGRLTGPRVPNEYFGNLVLWAFPNTKVKELLHQPLPFAAKLIQDAVTKVNNNYFRSFIDFASYKAEEEGLVTTAQMDKSILSPNLEVDSWLRFPFYDLDFGTGSPYMFMPTFFPTEGMMFLVPSFIGDASIDAFIPLFEDNLATFKQVCYSFD